VQWLSAARLREMRDCAVGFIDLEHAIEYYREQTGGDPTINGEGAVFYGAAALTLGQMPLRVSEDVDVILTEEFLECSANNSSTKSKMLAAIRERSATIGEE
jgi:hypothetical protein